MKMYTQYTNNYESASKILEQSAEDRDYLFQFIQVSPPPSYTHTTLSQYAYKNSHCTAHTREGRGERGESERYMF